VNAVPSPKVPAVLAELAMSRALGAGEVVFRAGAAARHVHFLTAGRVTLSRFGADGEEVAIHAVLPGEFFAEAALHSDRYHCTAVVDQPAVVASIPSTDLRALLRGDGEFAMQWLAIVSRQLRQSRARIERLSLKSAAARIRHLLLSEGSGPTPSYTLRGTAKDLALELGLSHESLYRTLAALQRDGVIARNGMTIALLR
jgi:CRP/FNR family transcriptional regulator, dissimilatory nitrate respiration regulator